MKRNKLFSILAFGLALPISQVAIADDDTVKDILNAISDDHKGLPGISVPYDAAWAHANMLTAVDPGVAGKVDVSEYWSGSRSASPQQILDIVTVQLILNAATSQPFLAAGNSSGKKNDFSAEKEIFKKAFKNTYPKDADKVMDSVVQAFDTALNPMILYWKLYRLQRLSESCHHYWPSEQQSNAQVSSKAVPIVIQKKNKPSSTDSKNDFSKQAMTACDKVECVYQKQRQSPKSFNGYLNFIKEVDALKASIKSADVNGSLSRALIGRAINEADDNLNTSTITSKSTAKSFVSTFSSSTDQLMSLLQAVLVNEILKTIIGTEDGKISPSAGFGSLYSSVAAKTPTQCGSENNKGKKVPLPPVSVQCIIRKTDTPEAIKLADYLDNLTGISQIVPPLTPGVAEKMSAPLNAQPSASSDMLWLNVAGGFYQFTKDGDLFKSVKSENSNNMWIQSKTADEIKGIRTKISSTFDNKQDSVVKSALSAYLAKSSAISILNEIKEMNSATYSFNQASGKGQLTGTYENTALGTLKESSYWRLNSDPSIIGIDDPWLKSIATMSNVSLLREISVLLAEMKHMQYLQVSLMQKQLAIQAISAAQDTDPPSSKTKDMLKGDIENFAIGSEVSTLSPPTSTPPGTPDPASLIPPVNTGDNPTAAG